MEQTIGRINNLMKLQGIMLYGKKPTPKDHILYLYNSREMTELQNLENRLVVAGVTATGGGQKRGNGCGHLKRAIRRILVVGMPVFLWYQCQCSGCDIVL